jgi:phospholipid transport system substrate-binding protein
MNSLLAYGRTLLLLAALGLAGFAQAAVAEQTPEALIQSTSEEMLAVIAKTQDRQALLQAVETKVAPHFNFARMTQLALGRSWQQASASQQQALEQEFRKLLVRTYTNAFATAKQRNAGVKVAPTPAGDRKEATVKTRVSPADGQAITIDYGMESSAAGWKVFDVVVDGVSLVTNYRDSFATEIGKSGIDGLIKTLAEKNAKNRVAAAG